MSRPEVIVVGLGAHGSATLLQLARRGVRVLGVDRWSPPHAMGSSHGETRITRRGVGEGEAYGALVGRSHEIWRELEAERSELLLECGALVLAPGNGRAEMHGKPDFVARSAAAARRWGVVHERLGPDEVRRRFPQFLVADDLAAYWEPGGGLVYPERCIAAQLAAAERLGARLLRDTQVRAIDEAPDAVRVTTSGGVLEADAAVTAAGVWTPGLIGAPLARMRLQPQVLHWFEADDPALYAADRCPVFILLHGEGPEDSFYGFPLAPGATPAVKVAMETVAAIADPEALDRTPPPGAAAAMHARHVAGRLRGVSARAVKSAVCIYTTAPDGDFALGRAGEHGRIWTVSACSGHGFKHSAGLGELMARAIVEGAAIPAAFDLRRDALALG